MIANALVLAAETAHDEGGINPWVVGAVILGDDFDRPSFDAAGIVDKPHRRHGGAFVPASIGGTDAGAGTARPASSSPRRTSA